jgi:hypothetical protein
MKFSESPPTSATAFILARWSEPHGQEFPHGPTALLRGRNSTACLPGVNGGTRSRRHLRGRHQVHLRSQYSYFSRYAWPGSNGITSATRFTPHVDNMIWTSLRYYLPKPQGFCIPAKGSHQSAALFLSIPCAYFKQPLLYESFSVPSPLFRIFNKLSSACNTPVMATPHTEG